MQTKLGTRTETTEQMTKQTKCNDRKKNRPFVFYVYQLFASKYNLQERGKLISEKYRIEDFNLKTHYKYSVMHDQADNDLEETNDQLTKIVMETAIEVGGKAQSNSSNNLLQETKDIVKNYRLEDTCMCVRHLMINNK